MVSHRVQKVAPCLSSAQALACASNSEWRSSSWWPSRLRKQHSVASQPLFSTSESELLRELDCDAYAGQDQNSLRLKKKATELQSNVKASDGLSRVLEMWKAGALLADEVDMLLHP